MRTEVTAYMAAGAGSALGAALRYWVSITAIGFFGPGFPWATLAVNILGSGLIVVLSRARWQAFWVTGFCGGFTTFSLFSLEVWELLSGGRVWLAAVYLGVSVTGWLLAAVWVNQLMRKKTGANRHPI